MGKDDDIVSLPGAPRFTGGPRLGGRLLIHHTSRGFRHIPMPAQSHARVPAVRFIRVFSGSERIRAFHQRPAGRTSVHSGAPFFSFPPRPRGHAPLTRPIRPPPLNFPSVNFKGLPSLPAPDAPSESLLRESWVPARSERLLPGLCDSRYGGRRLHMINLAHPLHASARAPCELSSALPSTFNGL